jgi:beta-xylosidase
MRTVNQRIVNMLRLDRARRGPLNLWRFSMYFIALAFLLGIYQVIALANEQAKPLPTNTSNPQQELRLCDMPVHDPFIVPHKESQTYYLYTSARPNETGLDRFGVMTYKSKDLLDWDGPYVVFIVPDGVWANPMHGTWAPEMHKYKSQYYLFVTLHNRDKIIAKPPAVWRLNHMRGTVIAISDSLEGPFKLLKEDGPHTPENFMTLDGTLYVDSDGQPWMVYCHEWIQVIDGTMEAIRLKGNLSTSIGEPIHLFKASDAPWINTESTPSVRQRHYVTDGPQLYRTKTDQLLMLWSSYNKQGYVQTIARSKSGKLEGPWEQLKPLVYGDSGHGMLFSTFDGKLMLVLHQPFRWPLSRAKLYEVQDTGNNIRIVRERHDLHGERSMQTPTSLP